MQVLELVGSRKFLFYNDQFLSNLSAEKRRDDSCFLFYYSLLLLETQH